MLPDRVSNPGPLTYESGALPIALRGPAEYLDFHKNFLIFKLSGSSESRFQHPDKKLAKVCSLSTGSQLRRSKPAHELCRLVN